MTSPVQTRGEKPSAKPLVVVAALLVLAATGAALTTQSAAAPVRHAPTPSPVQVVLAHLESPTGTGAGHVPTGMSVRRPSQTSWA